MKDHFQLFVFSLLLNEECLSDDFYRGKLLVVCFVCLKLKFLLLIYIPPMLITQFYWFGCSYHCLAFFTSISSFKLVA